MSEWVSERATSKEAERKGQKCDALEDQQNGMSQSSSAQHSQTNSPKAAVIPQKLFVQVSFLHSPLLVFCDFLLCMPHPHEW